MDFFESLTVGRALWAAGAWIVVTLLTTLAVVTVLLTLPPTYFRPDEATPGKAGTGRRWRWARRAARNALGLVLLIVGAVLSLPGVPGQGVLTMLTGVMLVDFPGRRRIERALIGRPGVLTVINRLRARFGRPPLLAPER